MLSSAGGINIGTHMITHNPNAELWLILIYIYCTRSAHPQTASHSTRQPVLTQRATIQHSVATTNYHSPFKNQMTKSKTISNLRGLSEWGGRGAVAAYALPN